jgi:hypothetical protein
MKTITEQFVRTASMNVLMKSTFEYKSVIPNDNRSFSYPGFFSFWQGDNLVLVPESDIKEIIFYNPKIS